MAAFSLSSKSGKSFTFWALKESLSAWSMENTDTDEISKFMVDFSFGDVIVCLQWASLFYLSDKFLYNYFQGEYVLVSFQSCGRY